MLQIKIESRETVVATIDFSRMEIVRKEGILNTRGILKTIENMGHQLPSYDKIYHNASKGIIELVVLEDGITVKDDEECIGGEDSF